MPAISARAAREAREEAARLKSRRYERAIVIRQKRYFSMIKQAAKTAVAAILPHSHQQQQPQPMQIQDDTPRTRCINCNATAKLRCIGCFDWICHDHTSQHGMTRCSRPINAPIHPEPEPQPELVEIDRPDTPRPDPYTEFHRCEMCFQLNNSQLEADEQCTQCGHWACDDHAESSCSDRGCSFCRGGYDTETESQPHPACQPEPTPEPTPSPNLRDFALSLTDQIAAAAVSSYRSYVTGATVAAINTATNNSIDYRQPTNPRRFCFRSIEFDVLPVDYERSRALSIQHKRYVDSLTARMFAVARAAAVLNHNNVLIVVSLSDDSTPSAITGSIEYYKYY